MNLFQRKYMFTKFGKEKFELLEKEVLNNFKICKLSCEGIKIHYTNDKNYYAILTYESYNQMKSILQLEPPIYLPYYIIKEFVKSSENIPEGLQLEEILFNGYPICNHQFEDKNYNYISTKNEFSRHPWYYVGRIPFQNINDLKVILMKLNEQIQYIELLKTCFPSSNLTTLGEFDGTTVEVGINLNSIYLNLLFKQIEIKVENSMLNVYEDEDEKLNQNASQFLNISKNIPILIHFLLKKKNK